MRETREAKRSLRSLGVGRVSRIATAASAATTQVRISHCNPMSSSASMSCVVFLLCLCDFLFFLLGDDYEFMSLYCFLAVKILFFRFFSQGLRSECLNCYRVAEFLRFFTRFLGVNSLECNSQYYKKKYLIFKVLKFFTNF